MAVCTLHVSAGARLDDRHVAAIIGKGSSHTRFGFKHAKLGLGSPNAEVLHQCGINADCPGALRFAASAFGDQLHIHERGFAWLIEALVGDHRIVPVQHFLASGVGTGLFAAAISASIDKPYPAARLTMAMAAADA